MADSCWKVKNWPGAAEAGLPYGRSVKAGSKNEVTPGSGWQTGENQTYTISEPDEDGDGTVPWRSGKVVRPACQSYMQVRVSHEPAYKFEEGPDNEMACRFTLRAIVKIAQEVQSTSLRYE